nr:MAG TPA: DNA adenine methylase [Caudoviricetes sp.]
MTQAVSRNTDKICRDQRSKTGYTLAQIGCVFFIDPPYTLLIP